MLNLLAIFSGWKRAMKTDDLSMVNQDDNFWIDDFNEISELTISDEDRSQLLSSIYSAIKSRDESIIKVPES